MSIIIDAMEKGIVPNFLVRWGIRSLIYQRKRQLQKKIKFHREEILLLLKNTPLAIHTDLANKQHYEVSSEFFELVLGQRLKYSCGLFEENLTDLDTAERKMIELYCARAKIENGQRILELGCGWGSLTLYLAQNYPKARITAISNSKSQRDFILNKAQVLGLKNLEIITCDINKFCTEEKFDRIISIEMFEHLRNYGQLFYRLDQWLKGDGLLFIHIFCHKQATYFFETKGDDNWMGKYFFTGGTMPSFDLFERVQKSLKLVDKWKIDGVHYQKTAQHWFKNMESNEKSIIPVLSKIYGQESAIRWFNRWKIFFAACEELFGHDKGQEWFVGHYLFEKMDYL